MINDKKGLHIVHDREGAMRFLSSSIASFYQSKDDECDGLLASVIKSWMKTVLLRTAS